jgi:hypothetical protein
MEQPLRDVMREDADDELWDEELKPPEVLRDAGEQLLRRAGALRLNTVSGPTVEDRLLALARRIGRIEYLRSDQVNLFEHEREPADECEREAEEERTRAFVIWCADQLTETAVVAIELAITVYVAVEPEYKQRAQIVAEMREELLSEMAMESDSLTRWGTLEPRKRPVADDVHIALGSIAQEVALAAYHWAESRWPGQAGLTAVEIAAQLLAHSDRIARAADYASWPGLEDE